MIQQNTEKWIVENEQGQYFGVVQYKQNGAEIYTDKYVETISQEIREKLKLYILSEFEKSPNNLEFLFDYKADAVAIHGKACRQKSENGEELYYVVLGVGQNNTEISSKLSAPQYTLKDLQEIIEGSFDGILVTDGDGNVQLFNESYLRITGIPKEELDGYNMSELVNPVWMKQSTAAIVKEKRMPVSLEHTTRYGKKIIVTGRPVFDVDGSIKKIVLNTRDISEIYALNQQLDSAKKMEKYYQEHLNQQKKDTGDLIAAAPQMQQIFHLCKKLANYNTSVLLTGESGVGKEEIAKLIHRSGLRASKQYVAINCGAIPESLLESELFGYEAGAFTGALKNGKPGIFESANGGTLLLDEIGEMPLGLQVKMLRVLENREITRIGGSRPIPVDIRVIAATHKDLGEMVQKQTFREDLFYRLNVVRIEIPPLRERKEDIPLLGLKFVHQYNIQYGENKRLSAEVIEEFQRYAWPGNVRELKNTVENMFVLSGEEIFQTGDIPWIHKKQKVHIVEKNLTQPLSMQVEQFEKQILIAAKKQWGSTRKIAHYLDLNQSTVVRKIKKYGIET